MAAKVVAATKVRKPKAIPNPDLLSEEQILQLDAVVKALPQFLEAQKFLKASPNAPTFAVEARDTAWKIVYKKLKLSGILKNKRKERTPEQVVFDQKKGQLLQSYKKAKLEHGPDHKNTKAAYEAFKAHTDARKKK